MKQIPNQISHSFKDSEFDVQAELWHRLQMEGIETKGSVRAIYKINSRAHAVYFDLVAFDKFHKPFIIIECKNRPLDDPNPNRFTGRQRARYTNFGLPVIVCGNRKQIEDVANMVISELTSRFDSMILHDEIHDIQRAFHSGRIERL
jgi:hypothetical protein